MEGWRSAGSSAGEMNGLGWTDGRGQDRWMAAEVCLLAAPQPAIAPARGMVAGTSEGS